MATVTKGKTFINGDLVTPAALHQLVDSATVTNISNSDISSAAAIADTKLATISAAGKIANSATTATALATPNAIVARNGSGDFAAGTIFANLSGNATNVTGTVAVANGGTGATTAASARTNLGLGNSATLNTGTASGTVATGDHTHAQLHNQSHAITSASDHTAGAWKVFHSNGSGQVMELALGAANSVLTSNGTASAPSFQTLSATSTNANNLTGGAAGAIPYQSAAGTTAMLSAGTSGQVLRSNGSAAPSWDNFGTSGNTAGAVVARDGFGNFSAGTITANLTGNATNVTGTVAVANGGTGATTAATARTNLGLGNSATLNTGTASGTVATGDHTHGSATSSTAGFMPAADKTKLDAATSANTASTIVARDASGNFSAGTITGTLNGSAATLTTGRTISLTGDITGSTAAFNGSANASAATSITNGAVTNAKLRNSAALSVIGNVNNVAGTPGDITANTDGHVLRRSGTTIAFGQVTSDGLANGSVTTEKLSNAAQQLATAWASINGSIADIATTGTTFTKVSDTVVRVARTAHGLINGDYVCFDALTTTNSYLNGTWVVSGVTANTFDFTISGAVVPATPTAQTIRIVRMLRQYKINKVGKITNGKFRFFFETTLASTNFICVGSGIEKSTSKSISVAPIDQQLTHVDVICTDYGGTAENASPLNIIVYGGA